MCSLPNMQPLKYTHSLVQSTYDRIGLTLFVPTKTGCASVLSRGLRPVVSNRTNVLRTFGFSEDLSCLIPSDVYDRKALQESLKPIPFFRGPSGLPWKTPMSFPKGVVYPPSASVGLIARRIRCRRGLRIFITQTTTFILAHEVAFLSRNSRDRVLAA